MPTPSKGETRKDWMARCIPQLREEGKPQAQAIAVCSAMFDAPKKDELDEEAMGRIGAMRPKPGEAHQDWMARCTIVGDEATCHALWTDHASASEDDEEAKRRKKKMVPPVTY